MAAALALKVKEEEAESYMDALSSRYGSKIEKSIRMLRTELDRWKLHKVRELDLPKILEENGVDFGFGEERSWLHQSPRVTLRAWVMGVLRKEKIILRS